jgi:hypothetical protein
MAASPKENDLIALITATEDAVKDIQFILSSKEISTAYYGSFYDTTTQTNPVANTANVITLNTTDLNNEVSVVTSGGKASRITINNKGVYNLQFSAQLDKTDGGEDVVDLWISKNGSNLAQTNTQVTLHSQDGKAVAAWNFFLDVENSGDYYELYWSSPDTNLRIKASTAASSPTRPAVPSVILTVHQVLNVQLGEQGPQGAVGPAGATGNSGSAATIAVGTVTTGAAGSSATVTNVGTTSAATFNFSIPQGAKGDTGEQGTSGNAMIGARVIFLS